VAATEDGGEGVFLTPPRSAGRVAARASERSGGVRRRSPHPASRGAYHRPACRRASGWRC